MKKQIGVFGPSLYPVVERNGARYVVDLKLGHFRGLSSPFHVISFSCSWGKNLAAAVGIRSRKECGINFIEKTYMPEEIINHADDGTRELVILEVKG